MAVNCIHVYAVNMAVNGYTYKYTCIHVYAVNIAVNGFCIHVYAVNIAANGFCIHVYVERIHGLGHVHVYSTCVSCM